MHILSKNKQLIINTESFAISVEKFAGGDYQICASDTVGGIYTLGVFCNIEEAKSCMQRIVDGISSEWSIFDMEKDA